ncbi:MAG: PAP2 family protein [Deltaproteobacteria bacterium]|nr:MAG: PAP2 family protein [Deltaproteobacteria bacterium]
MKSNKQSLIHLVVPFFVGSLAILSEYSGLDVLIESYFFDSQTGSWPYKSLFITNEILHTGGSDLIVLLAAFNAIAIIMSFFVKSIRPYRKHLLFVLIASATGLLIVNILKNTTHIYTPWSLKIFGGDKLYIRVFDTVPFESSVGHAFPGGHSSGGFAVISVYFALFAKNNKYQYYGLVIPLILGICFSITQEIRGAHFLSHDLFSFAICWGSSLAWSLIFFPDSLREKIYRQQ